MAEQIGYGRLNTTTFAATTAIDSDTLVADKSQNQRNGMTFKVYSTVAGSAQVFWVDGFGNSYAEEPAVSVTATDTLTLTPAGGYWPKRFVRFTPGSQPGSVFIEGAAY